MAKTAQPPTLSFVFYSMRFALCAMLKSLSLGNFYPHFPEFPFDKCNLLGYAPFMIKTFPHKGLEDFFLNGTKKRIQPKHADKISDILDRLDAATVIRDMNFPGSGLHLLEPKKIGIWSVKVSGNWRITFKFEGGDAYEVDYKDYH